MPVKNNPEIKTPADLLAFMRELGTTQVTALNGLFDKAPDAIKTEISVMREKLNTLLKGLPPLDQVPGAMEASTALNSFGNTIASMFEYMDYVRTRVENMVTDFAKTSTALNGLQARVTGGELIEKTTADAALDQAKTDAVNAATAPLMAQIAGLRKESISLCGLPEAPEAILSQSADAFTTSLAQAKKNLATCQARGFSITGKGAGFVKKTVWMDETAFNGEAKAIEDLVGTSPAANRPDPFKGTPGTQETKADTAPRKIVCA